MEISIETTVDAPIDQVWKAWVTPSDITRWNFASDEWCCPTAQIELVVGGQFSYRMEAKDGSIGFNFEGTFTVIEPQSLIKYALADARIVEVKFVQTDSGVRVVETFDAEDEHSAEQQRQGWQCILDNFKLHTENRAG
ncbi:SRPBCC family protein [Stieleria sp. JC731]|uniref:SRPBCC family protein n=1 Tax=Pirellulaceae TaxID=2691357 RepID=UPI001E4DFD87|nr:SRPBCC family protein [Stieleria sp. JC731]MCC9603728.1 SRPBCC family protein [Stieleria sp. JC731]